MTPSLISLRSIVKTDLLAQMSFLRHTIGGVAKCQLFSLAKESLEIFLPQLIHEKNCGNAIG